MGQHYILQSGYSWNPLTKFPRNGDCFCKSGEKFKKCCLSKVQPVVQTKELKKIELALKSKTRIVLQDGEAHSNKVETNDGE